MADRGLSEMTTCVGMAAPLPERPGRSGINASYAFPRIRGDQRGDDGGRAGQSRRGTAAGGRSASEIRPGDGLRGQDRRPGVLGRCLGARYAENGAVDGFGVQRPGKHPGNATSWHRCSSLLRRIACHSVEEVCGRTSFSSGTR